MARSNSSQKVWWIHYTSQPQNHWSETPWPFPPKTTPLRHLRVMCWPFFPYGNGETGRLESKVYWCGDLNFKPFVSWFPRDDLHPWAWRQKKTCRILESCSRIPTKHTHHTSWRCIHLKIQEWGRNGVLPHHAWNHMPSSPFVWSLYLDPCERQGAVGTHGIGPNQIGKPLPWGPGLTFG